MKEHAAPDRPQRFSRRRFLKIAAGSLLGAGVGGSVYSYFIEPYWLAVEAHKLDFEPGCNAPSGLRILHLSDLHRSDIVPASFLEKCVSRGNALKPDVVLLTGDYVTRDGRWARSVGEVLGALKADMGIFASLGNHDGGEWAGYPSVEVKENLEKAGIRVLVNESEELSFRGTSFRVAGLGDLWAGDFDMLKAFDGVRADRFTIALSHNPDTMGSLRNCSANLILSGHTHGGQVWVPLLGPPILPVDDTKYCAGVYREGEQIVYVNRGVGLLRKIRFNCRPEIALIEIA